MGEAPLPADDEQLFGAARHRRPHGDRPLDTKPSEVTAKQIAEWFALPIGYPNRSISVNLALSVAKGHYRNRPAIGVADLFRISPLDRGYLLCPRQGARRPLFAHPHRPRTLGVVVDGRAGLRRRPLSLARFLCPGLPPANAFYCADDPTPHSGRMARRTPPGRARAPPLDRPRPGPGWLQAPALRGSRTTRSRRSSSR